jgi:hypothetical protein
MSDLSWKELFICWLIASIIWLAGSIFIGGL